MACMPVMKVKVERAIVSYNADTGELEWTETLLIDGQAHTRWTFERVVEPDKLDEFWDHIDELKDGVLAKLKRDGIPTGIGAMRFE